LSIICKFFYSPEHVNSNLRVNIEKIH